MVLFRERLLGLYLHVCMYKQGVLKNRLDNLEVKLGTTAGILL
jgi:hypothetical protein